MNRKYEYEVLSDNAIEMIFNGKITQKNAFDVNVDFLEKIPNFISHNRTEDSSWQKASASLDASAKIYGFRVDAVHTDTFRFLNGLSRNDIKQEEKIEETKEVDKKEEGSVNVMMCHLEDEGKLQIKKSELDYNVDPLFRNLAKKFTGDNTKEMLMTVLPVNNNLDILLEGEEKKENVDIEINEILSNQNQEDIEFEKVVNEVKESGKDNNEFWEFLHGIDEYKVESQKENENEEDKMFDDWEKFKDFINKVDSDEKQNDSQKMEKLNKNFEDSEKNEKNVEILNNNIENTEIYNELEIINLENEVNSIETSQISFNENKENINHNNNNIIEPPLITDENIDNNKENNEKEQKAFLSGIDPSMLSLMGKGESIPLFLNKKTFHPFILSKQSCKSKKVNNKQENLFFFREIDTIKKDKIFHLTRPKRKSIKPQVKPITKYNRYNLTQYHNVFNIKEQLLKPFISNDVRINQSENNFEDKEEDNYIQDQTINSNDFEYQKEIQNKTQIDKEYEETFGKLYKPLDIRYLKSKLYSVLMELTKNTNEVRFKVLFNEVKKTIDDNMKLSLTTQICLVTLLHICNEKNYYVIEEKCDENNNKELFIIAIREGEK